MNIIERIGNYIYRETVRRLATNFLSELEDRMISGRKSPWIRRTGVLYHLSGH
jgi:hypothetical protein